MTGTPQVQSIRMRAVQAAEPGAPFQPATKIVPDPGPSQVRVGVHACGVCAGDGLARYGAHSVPERDRRVYTKAYARPGGMRAGFEYFRAFEKDAKDFARFAQTPLAMPMLVLTGEKASGDFLIQQGRLVATNVEGVVVRNSGHWLMEEAPDRVSQPLGCKDPIHRSGQLGRRVGRRSPKRGPE